MSFPKDLKSDLSIIFFYPILKYLSIYLEWSLANIFGIKQVKLNIPNATLCRSLFYKCSNLIDVDLQLPNVSDCRYMFDTCSSLNEIDLTLPNATNCSSMFIYCLNLVNVKLNLPIADLP